MTTGCAKQGVVKKEEVIAVAPTVRQVNQSDLSQSRPDTGPAPRTDAANSTLQPASPTPAPPQLIDRAAADKQLQAALNRIYFNFDSADLSESSRGTLSKNAGVLTKESAANIRIEGNCDERGSAEYNLTLGERRAQAAEKYLVALGVEQGRLTIVSYGNEKPAVRGNDEAGWAQNRRAEFVVVTK
jgi:peptidoglycan-associated lipoprotein